MTRKIAGMNVVTPSKLGAGPWTGTAVRGDVLTLEQRRIMAKREPGRVLPIFTVTMFGDPPSAHAPCVEHRISCPVVAETLTGRKIISPSGRVFWLEKMGSNQ